MTPPQQALASLLGLAAMMLSPFPGRGAPDNPGEGTIRRVFGAGCNIEERRLPVTAAEKKAVRDGSRQEWRSDSVRVLAAVAGDSVLGYGMIDDVRGKDQPITYIVTVGANLEIKDLEILAYRESYGGEVRNKSWQKQFLGKSPGDPLRPGKEISNISGATISARAVTLGVSRVLTLLRALGSRLPAAFHR